MTTLANCTTVVPARIRFDNFCFKSGLPGMLTLVNKKRFSSFFGGIELGQVFELILESFLRKTL
jgi:hypothetical protein